MYRLINTSKTASLAMNERARKGYIFYKFSPNPLIGRIGKDRAELVALALSSTFRSRNSGSMAEFRVESLT